MIFAAHRILLEITVATPDDALRAARGGADRLEVCSAFEVGGLTPTVGAINEIRRRSPAPLIAMLRPRAGGFAHAPDEIAVMRRDLDVLLASGVNGVALGVLGDDHTVDVPRCRELVHACGDREVVFHRAFDLTPDPFVALEQLVDLGVRRVLTGGGHPQVVPPSPGAALVARLIEKAAGRIEVLPAGGIRAHNVIELIRATGCRQVHSSCRRAVPDTGSRGDSPKRFGFGGDGNDESYGGVDAADVAALRAALDAVSGGGG